MKNLKQVDCIELTYTETQKIDGGSAKPKTGFWQDISYVAGAIVHGLVVFSTQGGRNAGLCVR